MQVESRYWINENLLKIKISENTVNTATAIISIIDEYGRTKQNSFQRFIEACNQLQDIEKTSPEQVEQFIMDLLAPNVDARLFEIVSYSILKAFYHKQTIIWGRTMDDLKAENLKLYKTGRTNANNGGIDFVMKPLGIFFQVTETLDFKKYFLDIDKLQKFPITFVIKSEADVEGLRENIRANASKTYSITAIVDKYMACIEEIINIPTLRSNFQEAVKQKQLGNILSEIIAQSKVEFNYSESEVEQEDELP